MNKHEKTYNPIIEKDKESSEQSSYYHYPIIGEDDKKIDSLDNIDIEKVYKMKDNRSKLQTSSVINWLRSRGGKYAKKIYLYFPDELIKNIEIKQIFSTFDKDGSNSLDRGELEEMFNKYNFKISKSDLKDLFKIVDDDKDDALNLKEFKKCALNTDANITFTNIMRKLRKKHVENKISDKEFKYLPMFFESMISFLSYKLNRDDTLQGIHQEDIPISDKLKKYLDLLELTARFGSNSALQKKNETKDMNLSPLSISSANTPYDRKNISPSIHQKNPNSTVKQFNNISQKNEIPKQDEPLKNFSNYFNNLQTQNRSNDRKTNVTEFKKEVKMIIKDAKKRAFRETNDKINIDFRPKNPSFTNLKVARAPLLLNNKDFKFNSSFYKNLTKSSKTEPLRHLSNIHQVIENSFKNEKKSIDEVLPKLKFPLPNNLREIDNVIYENFKGNNQKFLTWNSKKTNVDMESKKIKELKKELDYLNDIARNKYGINIPKKEIIPEADLKHSFFKLQPELLNSKILNFENNSIERNDNSLNISQQRIIGGDENLENGNIFYEKTENSSVPEFLLQNVFLANQEMKKLKGRKPQMMKSTRNFKSQIGSRNPYKTKINFASTYGGSFLKSI